MDLAVGIFDYINNNQNLNYSAFAAAALIVGLLIALIYDLPKIPYRRYYGWCNERIIYGSSNINCSTQQNHLSSLCASTFKTHDFKGLIADLIIKDLGIDIVYLLPIHPIGLKDRKGEVGSPYAIYDYYEIAKENGSLDDFKLLVDEVHKRGMKLMIDIVFNHTSRDSILTQKHPEWFYHKPDGSFANRVGDWSDITDFDFSNREVWDYLIDVLKYWAQYADGFRCDVAPLLPLDFWLEADLNSIKLDQISFG